MEKKKVLWLSDFACATGFSQVAQNIAEHIKGDYDLTVIGINHFGEPYSHGKWPFDIHPAINFAKVADKRYQDPFGRQRLLDELGTGEYDIVFTLQDHFVIEEIATQILQSRNELIKAKMKPFIWVFYYPVDGQVKDNWITKSVALADIPVAYTEFGEMETKRFTNRNIRVIHHGVNLKDFHPVDAKEVEEFRNSYFKTLANGKFLITNVNRNQRRKDIPRTIQIYSRFKELYSEIPAHLYLHMKASDVGGNIVEMCRHYDLELGRDYSVPAMFDENAGVPIDVLNLIYNASDVVMSTTLGEGWGLSSIEAMAVKTPVVFPKHTSLTEILADGRGNLVPAGLKASDWLCLGSDDNSQFRPQVDIDLFASALANVHNQNQAKKIEKAYQYACEHSWDIICEQWKAIFAEASTAQDELLKMDHKKIGANEPCPVSKILGEDVKWKKSLYNPNITRTHAL